jgi:hypothetical protein
MAAAGLADTAGSLLVPMNVLKNLEGARSAHDKSAIAVLRVLEEGRAVSVGADSESGCQWLRRAKKAAAIGAAAAFLSRRRGGGLHILVDILEDLIRSLSTFTPEQWCDCAGAALRQAAVAAEDPAWCLVVSRLPGPARLTVALMLPRTPVLVEDDGTGICVGVPPSPSHLTPIFPLLLQMGLPLSPPPRLGGTMHSASMLEQP